MLWPRSRTKATPAPTPEDVEAMALPVALDSMLFRVHFQKLLETAAQDGGIEGYLAALGAKHEDFAAALDAERAGDLALADVAALLECVFTARRRIYPAIESLGQAAGQYIAELLHGAGSLGERMQRFVDAMPGAAGTDRASLRAAAKLRRAAWDFAAELVHFSDPVRYPLMTRWVWDQNTQSGALREFIHGNDTQAEIPLTNDLKQFETARRWLAECIAAEGIYRDVALWIDLTLAQAYTTYLRAITDGSLGADFGRGTTPHEQLKKLLGIDGVPEKGRTRIKKVGLGS